MSHLTLEQRYSISTLLEQGFNQSLIAQAIGKDKSVISRELKRNSDSRNGVYKAELAQRKCLQRHTTKRKHIRFTSQMQTFVEEQLRDDFSPEQIKGFADSKGICCVSHERIYQHVWAEKKAKGTLHSHLRNKGRRYRKRGALKDSRGIIPGKVNISERPPIVEERTRFGDLEMDLIIGQNHQKAILTINDRASGMLKMKLLESKNAEILSKVAIELLLPWKSLLHTITTDNGKEFAKHQFIANQTGTSYFFANPYRSWERGSNENLNGLIRQYFPKKTDFNLITEQQIQAVEYKLNNRPRKRFDFKTPLDIFENYVAFMT
jgi:IS30 family transposase